MNTQGTLQVAFLPDPHNEEDLEVWEHYKIDTDEILFTYSYIIDEAGPFKDIRTSMNHVERVSIITRARAAREIIEQQHCDGCFCEAKGYTHLVTRARAKALAIDAAFKDVTS